MTRTLAALLALSLAGCASSKVAMRTYDGGAVTGGAIILDGGAPQAEGDALMDGVCGKGQWKVTKEEQVHPRELGNIAATSWARQLTFACTKS